MYMWDILAVVAGILFGIVSFLIIKRILPPGFSKTYWSKLGVNVYGLLHGDEQYFWKYYKDITVSTLHYSLRQMLGVFLALSPLIVFMIYGGPTLQQLWNRQAGDITAFPPEAATFIEGSGNGQIRFMDGTQVQIADPYLNTAICEGGSLSCLALEMFAFHTIDGPADKQDVLPVVVRSTKGLNNPFAPYLADHELFFFLAFMCTSVLLIIFKKGKIEEPDTAIHDMSVVDSTLTGLASGFSGLLEKLGNMESRKVAAVQSQAIDQPVFITGLARAGTTILLILLSKASTVATHRYRDFPFIMIPVIWNRFMKLFSAKQDPKERPHKDSIKITRDSPDAFEEPIWQYFFPFLHDRNHLHRLTGEQDNARFNKFFSEHLKKILYLRGGKRYLSKGNYNVARIEYLLNLFPDAKFLIVIRHPLIHVQDLMKQHELFSGYAKDNPMVPKYLEAVGHYEFGVQRVPIGLTQTGLDQILEAFDQGDDLLGYALQWKEIYGHVHALIADNPQLAKHIAVVRYEDLCADPVHKTQELLDFIGLSEHLDEIAPDQVIDPPPNPLTLSVEEAARCWAVVEQAASLFGYEREPIIPIGKSYKAEG